VEVRALKTIRQIADAANVSPATVSRVLSGSARVSPEKAIRVREAIARFGYRPDGPARSLRRGQSDVWAVIVPDVQNPFQTSLVRGVEDAGQANYRSVLLCNSDDDVDKERLYLDVAVTQRIAGAVIIVASRTSTDLSVLVDSGIPVVAVLRRHDDPRVDGVYIDDRGGAATITSHVIEHGATRPACITGPAHVSTAVDRLQGFKDAVRHAGIRRDVRLIRHADFRTDGGYAAARSLLEGPNPPDAIIATNNLMGAAALEACADVGLDVPGDVQVACFDDLPWGRNLRPQLTFVSYPAYALGEAAARLINDHREHPGRARQEVVMTPTLTVRGSTRAALLSAPSA
jgi:LacI family transcriptional regulator